jgi:hypothetical protein
MVAIANEWTDPDELEAVATEEARSADFNAALGNLLFLHRVPQVAVRLTSPQEVASGSDHIIMWDEATWQQGSMWDDASRGVIVIPRGGTYYFNFAALWEGTSDDASKRALFLEVNGTHRRRGLQVPAVSPSEIVFTGETSLAEGDYIEIACRQLSGEPLDLQPMRTVGTVRWSAPFVVDEEES